MSAGIEPNKVTASEIMSKPVITADPEMSIYNAALTMTKYKIRRLPIVRDTVLYRIITVSDLARRLYDKDKHDPSGSYVKVSSDRVTTRRYNIQAIWRASKRCTA